jgi:hypothetical protein
LVLNAYTVIRSSLAIVLQLIRIWVPVQFAYSAGPDFEQPSGNHLSRRKIGGVDEADAAALRTDRLLGHQPVAVGKGHRTGADHPILDDVAKKIVRGGEYVLGDQAIVDPLRTLNLFRRGISYI